jgi:hypothetical protein
MTWVVLGPINEAGACEVAAPATAPAIPVSIVSIPRPARLSIGLRSSGSDPGEGDGRLLTGARAPPTGSSNLGSLVGPCDGSPENLSPPCDVPGADGVCPRRLTEGYCDGSASSGLRVSVSCRLSLNLDPNRVVEYKRVESLRLI